MSSRTPQKDVRALWQSLETERTTVSEEQLHLKALESLHKSRRDMAARLVFAVMAAAFSALVIINTSFTSARLASVRLIAALVALALLANAIRSLYLSYKERVDDRGSAWSSCAAFYRRELERQQAFAAPPVWQMLAALFAIGWLTPMALRRSNDDLMGILFLTVLLGATGLLVLMAVRKFQARRLRHEIEALDSFEHENSSGDPDETKTN
jgi:hypothetical protein